MSNAIYIIAFSFLLPGFSGGPFMETDEVSGHSLHLGNLPSIYSGEIRESEIYYYMETGSVSSE